MSQVAKAPGFAAHAPAVPVGPAVAPMVAPRADQATRLRELISRGPAEAEARVAEVRPRSPVRAEMPPVVPPGAAPKIITITSGKGGVGKTSIAVNLAAALAARSVRVTLVDMDFGLANADVLCGVSPVTRLDAAVEYGAGTGVALERIAMQVPCGAASFTLIPGAVGLGRLPDLAEHQQSRLLSSLRSAVRGADVVIVDTGAGMGPLVRASAMCADLSLVVVTPEPTSLADAYALIKALSQASRRAGVAFVPPRLVVNQALSPDEAAGVAERLSAVAQKFLGTPLALAGALMQDLAVPIAVRSRMPFVVGAPGSSASLAVAQLAVHVADVLSVSNREPNRLPPALGFWDRVARLVGGRVSA